VLATLVLLIGLLATLVLLTRLLLTRLLATLLLLVGPLPTALLLLAWTWIARLLAGVLIGVVRIGHSRLLEGFALCPSLGGQRSKRERVRTVRAAIMRQFYLISDEITQALPSGMCPQFGLLLGYT
jgi:hypothetical protein